MIGWLIVLGILALLLGLLLSPLVFALDYDDPKRPLFLETVLAGHSAALQRGQRRIPEKRRESRRKRNAAKNRRQKKNRNTPTKKGKLKRYWKIAQNSLSVLPKPLRRLWKGLSLRHLIVGVQVGRFDAKECALAYGAANAAVYAAVGLLSSAMRVHLEQLTVQCAFGQERSRWVIRGRLHFLSAVRTSGAGQLCHGLCDAEKPAGRCRERTGGGKRTRCRPINRR